MSNLTRLVTLDVGTNQLTGPIPAGWSASPLLAYLSLHDNRLTGSIPPPVPPVQYSASSECAAATHAAGSLGYWGAPHYSDTAGAPHVLSCLLCLSCSERGSGNAWAVPLAFLACGAARVKFQ